MILDSKELGYRAINDALREGDRNVTITHCLGQRFICAGMSHGKVTVEGTPGNALGAYLNGADITVHGNAQDAVGDTMNDGSIIIHGNVGDAVGYAMRGGCIYVKGNAGYRAGIHMKAYEEKVPVMVIGGKAGSFLGEYQAGGVIVVLGLTESERKIVGFFPGTGMHGGKMYLRSDCAGVTFPPQVVVRAATAADKKDITRYVDRYCRLFGGDLDAIMDAPFTIVTPNSKNPYKQLYVAN